jgi:hypothetical protein
MGRKQQLYSIALTLSKQGTDLVLMEEGRLLNPLVPPGRGIIIPSGSWLLPWLR